MPQIYARMYIYTHIRSLHVHTLYSRVHALTLSYKHVHAQSHKQMHTFERSRTLMHTRSKI